MVDGGLEPEVAGGGVGVVGVGDMADGDDEDEGEARFGWAVVCCC